MRWLLALAMLAGCGGGTDGEATPSAPGAAAKEPATVGYDVRRLRPRNGETLDAMFARMAKEARAEGKHVAVLFSADWCEPCRILELEFGNMHPAERIGHVRILEMKEEDWERATRMNEFNDLRQRWSAPLNQYPLFLLLDESDQKIEEMKEAKERLEAEGKEATLPNWFGALAS
jgi:thiol-disulfide isomerase/thioredoxin